jgi:hypothetical protein
MDTRTEPVRASEATPELVAPELQAKMVAAFERARAERLAVQLPEDGADSASDPRTRSNTAAFLVLERERRVVAARLSGHYWRRRDRYRDLILATKLIHVEYEHLAGRAIESADSRSPSNGGADDGERPADWARPWGSGPLIEMDTALSFYQGQRDQLGRRLSILSRGSAAAAAVDHRDRILSRFEMARNGRLGQEPLSAPPFEPRAWPWTSPRFTRSAASVACMCAAIGVGAILVGTGGEGSAGLTGDPTPVVATVPDALLAVGGRQQARGRGDGSQAPQPDRSNVAADQAATSAPEVPAAAPEPVLEPAPAPVAPAPVAAPAPPPPEPKPQPDPKPRPGPVSPLPPPVDTLPPPGSSGG